jgi:hypothetical protein
MADIDIDLSQMRSFSDDIQRLLGPDLLGIVRKAANRAGAVFDMYVRTELPPPVRKQAAAPWWTKKQRAWWWGTMRKKALGKSKELPGWKAVYKVIDGRRTLVLSGGYKRTGTLIKTLTYEVRQTGQTTDVVYGTNSPYGKVVLDAEDQATYHKGNWKPLQTMATEAEPKVIAGFETVLNTEVEKRMGTL